MPAILDKLLRIGEGKILRQLEAIAKAVNAIEDDFVAMSDDELRGMTAEFKERLANGETLDDIMPEAFATVREAAKRVIGQRHYDVQIMGGAALHLGNIAEMKTGEGKTLVADPAVVPQRAGRQGRPRRHRQRLPREVPRGVDGPHPPLPRPDHRRDPARDAAPTSAARPTPATSPTAPTTSSASTTCATTWPAPSRTASSAATTSRSSTRSTRSSSTRRAPR